MSASLAPILLAGGGIAYVATKQKPAPAPGPTAYSAPASGSTLNQVLAMPPSNRAALIASSFGTGFDASKSGANVPPVVQSEQSRIIANALTQGFGVGSTWSYDPNAPIDPELQKKLDLIEAGLKKTYEDMGEVAKAEAAAKLNEELKLDPPLNGHEDWVTVAGTVGGAVGAAVGAYYGGPIGAKIGALVGAYTSTKLAELLAKNWDEIEDWFQGVWNKIEDQAQETYHDVVDWFGSVI